MQRSYVLQHAGRLTEALTDLDRAEQLTSDSDDARDLFRIRVNRGLVFLQQGRLVDAEDDFHAADRVAEQLGMTIGRAQCATNLGVLHGRARRLTESMRWFETAERRFAQAGNPRRTVAGMWLDRAEVMLYSGLLGDAGLAARRARDALGTTGNLVQLGDAQLILARVELAARRHSSALQEAQHARQLFLAAGRPQSALLADAVTAEVALAGPTPDGDVWSWTRTLADELEAVGWRHLADELHLARVRSGRRLGEASVLSDLEGLRLGAFSPQRNEVLPGWYAEATARSAAGDLQGAIVACTTGLDVVDEIVAETTSLERRSAAMRMADDLSQLAIGLAIELGDADTVLAAAEGTRARGLHEELQEQRPHRPLTDDGARELRRELAVRLGDRTLVEWVVSGDDVWAVVFDASGSRLVRVADRRDVLRARDRVLVWLDVAVTDPDDSSGRALRAATALDDLLLGPLELPPDDGIVLVPVGPLHGIPWAGLPTFAGRPMAVSPNAQLWLHADRRAAGSVRTIGVVVGPELASADVERAAIERCHPDAAVAAGPGATASTVRSMFGGHDLVHLAAHGRFRSDRPLLSTLRLHEGERPLDDVMPDRIGARLVVLSSCEGGAHGTADGSEVLGLSSVLLARGAASVVAPLTVVRDLECADFVAEVHHELADGEPVGCAVANVRGRWLADDDLSRWAVASSFTCFGSAAATVAG
jgi:tetratricopeptide (TPR) repeat protein